MTYMCSILENKIQNSSFSVFPSDLFFAEEKKYKCPIFKPPNENNQLEQLLKKHYNEIHIKL